MVALRLLFGFPVGPNKPKSLAWDPKSPYADGWGGSLKTHFAKYKAGYLRLNPGVSDLFLQTLSKMFHSSPEDRISPLVACQNLRNGYKPGDFLSLGMGDLAPVIIKPVLPADTWSDDNSIFRFRELDIEGVSEPLVMLEGCYVVNLRYVLKAKFEDKVDIEFATYKILESFEHTCWRFKSTNRLPERYIKIEPALELCEGGDHLQSLVDVLREQEALRNKAMAEFAARKENKDRSPRTMGLECLNSV